MSWFLSRVPRGRLQRAEPFSTPVPTTLIAGTTLRWDRIGLRCEPSSPERQCARRRPKCRWSPQNLVRESSEPGGSVASIGSRSFGRRLECLPVLNVNELYASHIDRVYAFFAYRVTSASDAEDLTSATFERVVRHAHRFDPARASVTTWLFVISENVLVDHYRRQGRRDERDFDEADDRWSAPEDRPSIGLSPELESALGSLNDRERRVIGLRFGADLSGKEIAALVGTSEANVHQLLSRALRRMRTEIGDVSSVR